MGYGHGIHEDFEMKRYIVTEEQLLELVEGFMRIQMECRKIPVPDWATHFYGPDGKGSVWYEEFPK